MQCCNIFVIVYHGISNIHKFDVQATNCGILPQNDERNLTTFIHLLLNISINYNKKHKNAFNFTFQPITA